MRISFNSINSSLHKIVVNTTEKKWFRKDRLSYKYFRFRRRFWSYPIKEPLKFLSYFFYRIDFNIEKDEDGIIDSIACQILEVTKYEHIHPYYVPELDQNIIAEANIYKSQNL